MSENEETFLSTAPEREREAREYADKIVDDVLSAVTSVPSGEESETNLQVRARNLVRAYYNKMVERGEVDQKPVTTKQVYIVWFAKVLGNWKAMAGTVNSDGLYFEITHNGETNETYVDCYEKQGQMTQGPSRIAEMRRAQEVKLSDIHKAAVHAAERMKEDWGYDNAKIADNLGISESSVRFLLK